jgi:hypothetical protein
MQTPAITVLFSKLGYFILEKQLTNQKMFLVQSEVEVRLITTYNSHAIQIFSITAYLVLALYGSTTLQSQLFLKTIKNSLYN